LLAKVLLLKINTFSYSNNFIGLYYYIELKCSE